VIDVEPLIRDELPRVLPVVPDRADWGDVVGRARRSGRPWVRRPLGFALAAALAVLLAAVALAATLGGFDDWLRGAPGKPASEEAQERFRAANGRSWAAFPTTTELRELIRTEVAGRDYALYGFVSGESLCLQLAADGIAFQPRACAPRTALANTSAPVVVVLPEHTFFDRASRPAAQVSFGIAADGVRRVTVEATDGRHRARIGGNAYLFVEHEPNTGNRVHAITAVDARGRRTTIRLPDAWPGEATGVPGGPTRVDVRIERPTVGWLEHGEKRGFPAAGGVLRAVKPDPLSNLAVGVSGYLCLSAIDSAGKVTAQGCGPTPFARGPLNALISCRFCGEFMELRGVAADGVARVVVFAADGSRLTVPLRHNLFASRVARTQFPFRLVGYDARDRVVAAQLWDLRPRAAVPPAAKCLRPVMRAVGPNGTVATLAVGPRTRGFDCWRVAVSGGPARGRCIAPYSGSRFAVDLVQPAGGDVFVAGRAGDSVRRIELLFATGDKAVASLVRGHFLLAVPSDHLTRRRQRAFVVSIDAAGTVRARQRIFFRLQ
jgi:hypothetical protein